MNFFARLIDFQTYVPFFCRLCSLRPECPRSRARSADQHRRFPRNPPHANIRWLLSSSSEEPPLAFFYTGAGGARAGKGGRGIGKFLSGALAAPQRARSAVPLGLARPPPAPPRVPRHPLRRRRRRRSPPLEAPTSTAASPRPSTCKLSLNS